MRLRIKRKVFRSITVFLLAIVLVFSSGFTSVNAATAQSGIVDEIDYSGQGTKLDGEIADGQATVSGNYVNVPIYKGKYDTSWTNVNDWWLWHSWSDWSPSNNKINDYHTYVGQTMTEYDVESKEEHMYHRYNPDINPVYKTKYYTEFKTVKKILFVTITTYHTESSWNGYPGAISGKTIHKQWTKSEFSHNAGGYETTGWRNSAPITLSFWPFNEPAYTHYQTRTTYRYRSRTIDWNARGGDKTTQEVPLNYSLKDTAGNDIGMGIKLSFNLGISEYENYSGLGVGSSLSVVQYYISSTEAKRLLVDNMEEIEDAIAKYGFLSLLTSGIMEGVGSILSAAILKAIGIALLIVASSDYIMGKIKDGEINSMQEFLKIAERENLTIIIQETNHSTYGVNSSFYYNGLQTAITQKSYVSMRMSDNDINSGYLTGTKNFGIVSYVSDMNEISQMIKHSLQYTYPTFLPWNW